MSNDKELLKFINADVKFFDDVKVIDSLQVPVYPDMSVENKIKTFKQLAQRAALMQESKTKPIVVEYTIEVKDSIYHLKYTNLNGITHISLGEEILGEETEFVTYQVSGGHFTTVKDYIRFYYCDENDSLNVLKCAMPISRNADEAGKVMVEICRELAKLNPSPYHSAHITSYELYHEHKHELFTIDWFLRNGIEEASYDKPYHTDSFHVIEGDDLTAYSVASSCDVSLDYICHVDDKPLEDTSYNYSCSIEKEDPLSDLFIASFDEGKSRLDKLRQHFPNNKIYFLANQTVENYSPTNAEIKAHWWAKVDAELNKPKAFEVEINIYSETDVLKNM